MVGSFSSQASVPDGSQIGRHAPARKFLRPAAGSGRQSGRASAITRRDPGTMRVSGALAQGPGKKTGGRPPSEPPNKRSRGARTGRPAQKTGGKLCEGPERLGEARGGASRRNAPHNSRAERGKAGRPAPAPPGPGSGSAPYLVVLLPAARGRRRPTRAARHVHVQGAGERAPQGPHSPRQPHGRQAQAQPAREQSHRGPAAARSDHRRGEEEDAPPPPAAAAAAAQARAIAPDSPPIQPLQGRGRGWGGAGGAQPSRLPGLLRPRNAAAAEGSFHPEHKRNACGAFSPKRVPSAQRARGLGGGTKGARIRLARVPASRLVAAPYNGGNDFNINTSRPGIIVPKAVTEASPSLQGSVRSSSGLSSP